MTEPTWLLKQFVLALHERQLVEHGGPAGLRDEGALESALARPENRYAYGETDLGALAAAYAFGLAKNHAFLDGNKRISFSACAAFLMRNGFELPDADEENIAVWLALAAGDLSEAALADWLRARIRPLGRSA